MPRDIRSIPVLAIRKDTEVILSVCLLFQSRYDFRLSRNGLTLVALRKPLSIDGKVSPDNDIQGHPSDGDIGILLLMEEWTGN